MPEFGILALELNSSHCKLANLMMSSKFILVCEMKLLVGDRPRLTMFQVIPSRVYVGFLSKQINGTFVEMCGDK